MHGIGLKCHQDDFECIWKAYERLEKCGSGEGKNGVIIPGGQTDRMFRKNIDIEIGIRLAKAQAMTPEEMEWRAEQKRLTRQKKSLESRLTAAAEAVKKLEETIEKLDTLELEDDHPVMKQFRADLAEAKEAHAGVEEKLDACTTKLDNCTLENVKNRLEGEKAIKKLTADDLKKEKEEEKAEEQPKEAKKTTKKAKKEAEKK